MPRAAKAKQTPTAAADVDIDSFFASQQSTGSDDGMMTLIAQQVQASLEKKNKQRDAKYVQATKNELQKVLKGRAAEVLELKDELSGRVEDFMTEYAENEDAIRALWLDISKHRDELMTSTRKEGDQLAEAERSRAEECVGPLTRYKAACDEVNRTVASLVAPSMN
ncbi:hypothetical protein FA95DRAFT_1682437 [Auriscalpium vulgare]|uniref:Uncharacterized protein n=1 Tax=Auriscalpium vulgare TaxID=40419 RepID=A0ACB8RF48_9AGAM|nr:hypothetical protein FA95DRAFT_1682437 [Auriscalpium vulgare]